VPQGGQRGAVRETCGIAMPAVRCWRSLGAHRILTLMGLGGILYVVRRFACREDYEPVRR